MRKAFSIWVLIVFVESINGTLREFLITPAVGGRSAHQIGFFIGTGLILFIAWLTASWLKAESLKTQLKVGCLWLILMVAFEFSLGYLRGFSWEYVLSDYDLSQGGLMAFGLIVLLLAPTFGARLRARAGRPQAHHSNGMR